MQRGSKKLDPSIERTTVHGVSAEIRKILRKNGQVKMSGVLVDSRTHIRLDEDIRTTKTVPSTADIDIAAGQMIATMVQRYHALASKGKCPAGASEKRYTSAYALLNEDELRQLILPGWRAESTKKQGIAYFKSYLALLDTYCDRDPDATDREEILQKLQTAAEEHGNHRGNPNLTAKKVEIHAKAVNAQYAVFRELVPQLALPEIVLPLPQGVSCTMEEQVKALSTEVRVKLSTLLLRLIENGLAAGAVIMLCGMARTAEACAPLFGEILLKGDFAVYAILTQANGRAVRIDDLKTDSAYRLIILPKFAVDAILARKQYLNKLGYSDAEIQKMPVVSSPRNPAKMASPDELSAFVRELLIMLGHEADYWKSAEALMEVEPDRDDSGRRERDPSAYVLRRNACTLLCNVAGLDPDLVDALMGHKLLAGSVRWDRFIRRPDNWAQLANQMERIVYHPEHSANPALRPLAISAEQQEQHDAQIGFVLQATEETDLILAVDAAEAADEIKIELPNRSALVSVPELTVARNEYAPIIGLLPDKEKMQQWVTEASQINLSSLKR